MGSLAYDSLVTVEFDDRVLAHLQLVIAAKLRRNESFTFSWRDNAEGGEGRTTVWLHPTMPLMFKYDGGMPPINRQWIDALVVSANSTGGLHIVSEPEPPTAARA